MKLAEQILTTIIQKFSTDRDIEVTGETTIGELQKDGMDSLDQVEMLMDLEDELGLVIDEFEPLPPEMTLKQLAEKIAAS